MTAVSIEEIPSVRVAVYDRDGSLPLDEFGLPARWREVTPLWRFNSEKRCDDDIPRPYHAATLAMAESEFFRGQWDKEATSKFLMIRDRWLEACEAAIVHDWNRDRKNHASRKSLDKEAHELAKATRKFRKSLASASRKFGAAQKLAYVIQASIEERPISDDEMRIMTSSVPASDVLAALDRVADHWEGAKGLGSGLYFLGPINWTAMPERLPSNATALGLQLADLFTTWRADSHQNRQIAMMRAANRSADTPWKIIALFVKAALNCPVNERSLQTSVIHAIKAGARIGGNTG